LRLRRGGPTVAELVSVLDVERVDLDVDHDVVLDAVEVPLDVVSRPDAEEELRARLGALALEANGEPTSSNAPVRASFQIEVVGAGGSVRSEGFPLADEQPSRRASRVRSDEHLAREEGERTEPR
jgi:hypothetical protein